MTSKELVTFLEEKKIPISGFYWCCKWNLSLNEKFGIDVGSVKIIYEGFRDQNDRRCESENYYNTLYLCIIFYFEKYDFYLLMETTKNDNTDELTLPTNWYYKSEIYEVKVEKKMINVYKEKSSVNEVTMSEIIWEIIKEEEISHLMTLKDFLDHVEGGCFIDYDGWGYAIREIKISDGPVLREIAKELIIKPSKVPENIPMETTHINWINR